MTIWIARYCACWTSSATSVRYICRMTSFSGPFMSAAWSMYRRNVVTSRLSCCLRSSNSCCFAISLSDRKTANSARRCSASAVVTGPLARRRCATTSSLCASYYDRTPPAYDARLAVDWRRKQLSGRCATGVPNVCRRSNGGGIRRRIFELQRLPPELRGNTTVNATAGSRSAPTRATAVDRVARPLPR